MDDTRWIHVVLVEFGKQSVSAMKCRLMMMNYPNARIDFTTRGPPSRGGKWGPQGESPAHPELYFRTCDSRLND